jgi:DNA invertase Pin-like site-specific DNA recombinase
MSNTKESRQSPPAAAPEDLAPVAPRCLPCLGSAKIQPIHRERLAIVYVRQSSPRQVVEHRESRARQYALVDYAESLGWPRERVLVIDDDQGQSGQRADNRLGFQRLLSEVTLDHVGLVLGLEMSRLARSNKDWYQLLDLCGIFGTLLADQEGVYDSCDSNDRLVLGLKGTMSELEIQTMRNRLDKGKLHKAQRGELFCNVALGYVKTPSGVARDPDEQVQAVLALIFDKFDELGSVRAVFRYLLQHDIRVGIRVRGGPQAGQLQWLPPCPATLYRLLRHPLYAGTYVYGRTTVDRKRGAGGARNGRRCLPPEQWKVVRHDHLPAYISGERFRHNQERLRQNGSHADTAGTPRRGVALLQGLVFCRQCETRLRVLYSRRHQPRYDCVRHRDSGAPRTCHGLSADALEALVVQQVLRALEPAALEFSLRAGADVQRERERRALHWQQQLERAGYDAVKAERHYRAVDPENRLVARTLEQQWEQALRRQQQLQEEYDRFRQQTPTELTPQERECIRALADDLPALWCAATTTVADRKEILRCLLERVVVGVQGSSEYVDMALHWAGGFVSQHQVVRRVGSYAQLRDFGILRERICQLRREGLSAGAIAERLHTEGFRPLTGKARFRSATVRQLLSRWGVSPGRNAAVRLDTDEWRLRDLASKVRVQPSKLRRWIRLGWVRSRLETGVGYIVWADRKELRRLSRLRAHAESHPYEPYPEKLTTPGESHRAATGRSTKTTHPGT